MQKFKNQMVRPFQAFQCQLSMQVANKSNMIHMVYLHFMTDTAHPSFSIMDFIPLRKIAIFYLFTEVSNNINKYVIREERPYHEWQYWKYLAWDFSWLKHCLFQASLIKLSVLEASEENMAKFGLIQQGIPKDQIGLYDVSEVRNIQKAIKWLRDQLLAEEGRKLILGDKAEEIRSRLNLVDAELEGLTSKMANFLNPDKTCLAPGEFSNMKDRSIAEFEKKIGTYEEKLIQAMKKEEELEEKIAKLTSMISSINPSSLSKEAIVPKPKQCMEYIRKCTLEEQNLIQKQYSRIKQELEKRSQKILLYYTYRNDKPNENNCSKEFRQWVDKLIEEFEPGADCYSVVQAFILNPKDNQLAQDYHMDYNEHMRTFFVSMDYLTTLNSTQYFRERLQQPSALSIRGGIQYGNDEKEILNRENREFMEISQMVCKPYNILLMKPGTAHRGIANRSGVDRVLFSVTYTDLKGFLSGQPKIATQKQDVE